MRHDTEKYRTGEQLLTLREAAEVLRLHPRTAREYVWRGELEGRLIGRRWRFIRKNLDAFYENAPRWWDFKGKSKHGDWMVEQAVRARGWHQQFIRFHVYGEAVPCFPACVVRALLSRLLGVEGDEACCLTPVVGLILHACRQAHVA